MMLVPRVYDRERLVPRVYDRERFLEAPSGLL
jgi:hypothetical protein